jgi:hypothetical protein
VSRRFGRAARAAGLLLFVAAASASAQVNVEKLPRDGAESGVSGNVDALFSVSEGNSDLLDVGLSGLVQQLTRFPGEAGHAPGPPFRDRLLFVANRSFSSVEDRSVVDRGFAHLRWTRMRNGRWGTDAFAQYQFDEFRKLSARAIAGVGVRLDLLRGGSDQTWLGTAAMFELERIEVDARDAMDGGTSESRYLRWTSYLGYRHRDGNRLALQNTIYFQPRFDDFSDFRVLEGLDVDVSLGGRLSVGIGLEVQYDSDPPQGVENADVRVRNAVRLRF